MSEHGAGGWGSEVWRRVDAVLQAARAPMSAPAIMRASGLSRRSVYCALEQMGRHGTVVRLGERRPYGWWLKARGTVVMVRSDPAERTVVWARAPQRIAPPGLRGVNWVFGWAGALA